jgi:hypothetical protein
MGTGARDAVTGYVDLGTWLLKQWGDHALKVANRLDTGTYTVDGVVADTAECTALSAQSFAYIVNEAWDAFAVLGGTQDQPHYVTSGPFSTDKSAIVSGARTLRLAGPLQADLGSDQLPASAITIEPATLQPSETTFYLRANTTGHEAVAYSGNVEAVDATGLVTESIPVFVA